MSDEKEQDRLIGVYPHSRGGFEIKTIEGGKPRSRYRRDETAAWKAARRLEAKFASGAGQEIRPLDALLDGLDGSSPEHWRGMLWEVSRRMLADPENEPLQRLERIS
jgi:hypothetical protein